MTSAGPSTTRDRTSPLTMAVEALGRTLARLADQDPAVAVVCDALLDRLP